MRHKWPVFLLTMALCCAASTIYCLANYPRVASSLDDALVWAIGLNVVAAPVIWVVVLVKPAPATLAALQAHAAFLTALLVIEGVVAGGVWSILVLILVAEALLAKAARLRVKKLAAGAEVPSVYVGLTTALLGGWFAGFLIWSTMLPRHVADAAESAAGDRPYCIDVGDRPAESASDLRGLRMRAATDHGWASRFHALLVIDGAAHRSYMNWSYRTGRFEPVSDSARVGLRLDGIVKCAPRIHFARDWL